MGWAYGVVNGREVGYSVEATCDHPDCSEAIDRGLSYCCGDMPGNSQGCGQFFCTEHLEMGPERREGDDFPRQLCIACRKEWEGLLGSEAYYDATLPRLDEEDPKD